MDPLKRGLMTARISHKSSETKPNGKQVKVEIKIAKKPKAEKNRIWSEIASEEGTAIGDLWGQCEVVVLKTNFRQGQGNPWTELLNRLRVGQSTEEDIKFLASRQPSLLSKLEYDQAKLQLDGHMQYAHGAAAVEEHIQTSPALSGSSGSSSKASMTQLQPLKLKRAKIWRGKLFFG